jgi:hypothetical protein
MEKCFLCKRMFHFGNHVYAGRHIHRWDMMVCEPCHEGNCEGIVPEEHSDLVPHLEARGIPVNLNAKGWIDFPS